METADGAALRRIFAVEPTLRRLERAVHAVGLGRMELLHAGPPIRDPELVCRPILHSAITASLFEGWAESVEQAEQLVRRGDIKLHAAQDRDCVAPLADVVSPSMWLQAVGDGSLECWSPINGGVEHVLRVGVLGEDVLDHVRWVNDTFARAYRQALSAPIPILELADEGLAAGDDCHSRTGVATAALSTAIAHRLSGDAAEICRQFLQRSPGFFLNIWMAASKLMLGAARGIERSTVITAAAGNGTEFGIKIAGKPDAWFVVRAAPPIFASGATGAVTPLGAIGDSAVVDILGLGAMTSLEVGNSPPIPDFVEGAARRGELLSGPHPRFSRTRARMVISAQRVVEAGTLPVISLGVLDSAGRSGRLGGGYYRVPRDIFERAAATVGVHS